MAARGEQQSPAAAIDLANRRLTHLVHQGTRIEWIMGTSDFVPRFVGWAEPGTATSDPKWRIVRITFDANDLPIALEWPDKSIAYAYIWDNRGALTYS